MRNDESHKASDAGDGTERAISETARRALAEAEERSRGPFPQRPQEFNGRPGLDPVRYGDWEIKGLASDF